MEGWGNEPAGWVYVAWHPDRPGYTKVGYTKWDPTRACEKYKHGIKRIHRIENYLEAFGFGKLKSWQTEFHPFAKLIELSVRRDLAHLQRGDVGRNKEIYNIDYNEMIAAIQKKIDA